MRRRFRRLFRHLPDRPDLLEREIDDEIASHLAERIERLEHLGMSPNDARAEALRRFGDVTAARRQLTRSAQRRSSFIRARERSEELSAMIDGLKQDARLALRTLRLHKAFAVATIATLGLVIAAAVTAFSFVDAIFLRPLPAPAAGRLVHVYLPMSDGRYRFVGTAGAALLREQHDIFDRVAAEDCCWVRFVRERGALDQRYVAFASADFFPLLGVTPALGRFFRKDETASRGTDAVAILNYDIWQRVFDGDPHVLGEHIAVSGRDFTIIGVTPAGFDGIGVGRTRSEIWLPSTMTSAVEGGCAVAVPCDDSDVLARLAPGVSAARAAAGLERVARELSRLSIGDDSLRRPVVLHASGALMPAQHEYSPLAQLLGAIAGLLVVIACTNLSGLLVVRGVARGREIALRLSLGAHRIRVMQQLLVESGALAVVGGALGLVLSIWTSHALIGFFVVDSEGFENYFPIGLDARVLWFAVGISLAATLAFGLLPAFLTARAEPAEVLKSGTPGGGRARAHFELVAVQVAITSALLTGAVLLTRSFTHLLHEQRFEATHVALLRVRPEAAQYDTLQSARYVRAVADRIAALPEVEEVAFARGRGFVWSTSPLDVAVGTAAGDSAVIAQAHFVSPGFFHTLRINLLSGREFTSADAPNRPNVAMVSESLAHLLSPTTDIVGRTMYTGGKAFRVIGVVPDYLIKMSAERVAPLAFFSFWQHPLGREGDARFAVRVHGDPARMLATLRAVVRLVDPAVPVAEIMTLEDQIDASYPQINLGQTVLLAAGGLALLLSAIGLYGVIAFLVTRRTREIGIRVALGAVPARVAASLVGKGMLAVSAGVAAGMAATWMLTRLLGSWLVDVSPHEPLAFAISASLVAAASLLACTIPAWRAARIDPTIALRAE
jgi:predicted permease